MTDPVRARWALPRRYRSASWAFSYSANMPWNWTSSWSSGAVAARALDELHPHPGPGELLQQQRLVGELAGQPVRGVAQHHVHAALGGQVPQRLQGRADQRRAGMALVFEDPLLRDVKPGLRGVLAQRRGLRPDRLVLLLPGAGDPGVDRRARHGAAVLPGQAARCGPAAAAPIWRRPPTIPWPRDGRRRTPSRPPGRSPAGIVSAAPRQELGQRLRHHGGDRGPASRAHAPAPAPASAAGSLTVNTTLASGTSARPDAARLVGIPAGLPRRDPEPARQHPRGLRRRHARLQQLSSGIDTLSLLASTPPGDHQPCHNRTTRHVTHRR